MKKITTLIFVFLFLFINITEAQNIDSLDVRGSSDTIYVHAKYGSTTPGTIIYFKCSDVGFGGPSLYSPYHSSPADPDAYYDFVFTGLILNNNYCIRAVLTDTGGIVMDFRDTCLVTLTGVVDFFANSTTYSIYPNPVMKDEKIIVNVLKKTYCEFFNFNGQFIFRQELSPGINEIKMNLLPGLYFLSIGERRTKLIVK
jgi:hypothetical protein